MKTIVATMAVLGLTTMLLVGCSMKEENSMNTKEHSAKCGSGKCGGSSSKCGTK